MTVAAKAHAALCIEPEQPRAVGAVGIMATSAVKGSGRARGIHEDFCGFVLFQFFRFAKRMTGGRESGESPMFLGYLIVTGETNLKGVRGKKRDLVG